MSAQLLEIHPGEVKFIFEVKKQSSCAIHLTNVTDQYVAFKVKTTSPKKYCVRPNTGIVKPRSTCDFTVTMQAQRSAPPDMECKDKFLIQGTVVHFGTTEDDITPDVFLKASGKYIEENKLRVILNSPPHSPVLPHNTRVLEQEPSYETSIKEDKLPRGNENIPPAHMLNEDVGDVKSALSMEESKPARVVEGKELSPAMNVTFSLVNDVKLKVEKDAEEKKLMLTNEIKELKSKAEALEHKLKEAKSTILDLNYQNSKIFEAKERLKQELAGRRNGVNRIQEGFSLLFVCMIAFIGLTIGYLLHP